MTVLERARWVVDVEREELRRLSERIDGAFEAAVSAMRAALDSNHKIVMLGVGKSGHVGAKIAATMTSTGSRAVVLSSLDALHGDLGIVDDGDAVVAISYSGETEELTAILPALRRFDVQIVALTSRPTSTLAKWSDHFLDISVATEACPLGLAPTSSTTVTLALGDALAMALLEQRGFRHEDFAKFHPAGRLGRRLLLKVCDIMRPLSECAVAHPGATVLDAVREMNAKRSGAVVVIGPDGTVMGVFTQGDFTREYQKDAGIGARPLGEVMTVNPVTLADDAAAVEVLAILENRKIDDIIVVDASGRLAGVVDSQDLARHQLC